MVITRTIMTSKSNIFIELLFQAWDNESKAGKYRYISLAQVLPQITESL